MGDLAEVLGRSENAVSQALRVLRQQGWVSSTRVGRSVSYRLEDEIVHVFGGRYDGPAKPNAAEVSDWKWIAFDELESDLRAHPENYAVWFCHYLTGHGETIAKWIGR